MTLSKEERSKKHQEGALKRTQEKYNKTHKIIDGIVHKQCICHKEYFPDEDEWFPCTEEYFYPNKMNGIDGLNTWCKECSKKKATKWSKENRDKYLEGIRRNNAKPEVKIQIREAAKKQREEGKIKEWQQNNRDKTREYSKKREQKNHRINKKEWEACLSYFNNCCAYCGMSLEEHKHIYNQQLHKEHVVYNGKDDLSNCVPSCQPCNSQKWEFKLEEWYNKSNPNFTQEKLDKINKWLNEDYKQYIEEHKPKGKYIKKNKEYWDRNK